MNFPDFAWGCGEEASDPVVWFEDRDVRVDELAASGHLSRQDADLADVASLGVDAWRYGMPWRLVERAPGEYDWSLWDRALAACDRHGLTPVVDLCHFGLPDHYPGFCDPAWIDGFLAYVEAFLARYSEPQWFTPVNEPAITAFNSGLFGMWNDRRASREDFARALGHCVLANLEALHRIRADRDGWLVGAEGFAAVFVADPSFEQAAAEARALNRAVWDLTFGRPLDPRVEDAFAPLGDALLPRIAGLATTEHVIAGHDFYPVSVLAFGVPADELSIADRLDAYEAAARDWHARYGVDFWVAETSNLGLPVSGQVAWLEAFSNRLAGMKGAGLPVRGLCWYSRGDQYDWHTALTRPVGEVTEVGLFDADRRPRPVADAFRRLASPLLA